MLLMTVEQLKSIGFFIVICSECFTINIGFVLAYIYNFLLILDALWFSILSVY